MADRLSTGVPYLDEQLGGGLVPGRLVCLRTSPESQGELLLREAAISTGARYLSTTRTAAAVADWLWPAAGVEVEYVGADGLAPRGGEALRAFVREGAGWSPNGGDPGRDDAGQLEAVARAVASAAGAVVVDPVNPLERATEPRYVGLVNDLQRRVDETGSVAFLHVVEAARAPDNRWVTLQMADEVWDVSVTTKHGDVSFFLTVTKSRSDDVPRRQLKLDLGRNVDVDTSRDIG